MALPETTQYKGYPASSVSGATSATKKSPYVRLSGTPHVFEREGMKYVPYEVARARNIWGQIQDIPSETQGYQQPTSKKAVDVSRYEPLINTIKTGSRLGNLGIVTTPYGGSTKFEKFHPGIDIAAAHGSPIRSFVGGKVTEVVGGQQKGSPSFGNYIIITDQYGNKHRYSHLNRAFVRVGQEVTRGTTIGDMGNTGQVYSTSGGTGTHLDYRVRDMYNKYINPTRFIYG